MREVRGRNAFIGLSLLGYLLGCGPMTQLRPMTLKKATGGNGRDAEIGRNREGHFAASFILNRVS
jgi:hypothetical protein